MPRRNLFAIAMVGAVSLLCWQATQGAKPKDEMMELYGLFVDAVEQVESQLRPAGQSPRAARKRPARGCSRTSTRTRRTSTPRSGSRSRSRSRAGSAASASQVGIDPDANRLKVIAPMVGTPAYGAGVLAGDLILEIDGQSTEGMTPDKAVEVLTGRPGTPVKLTVLHEGDEKAETLTMTRAIIDVPSVLGDLRKADDRLGLHVRQGQEDRLHPDHQLHPEHDRGAQEGPRRAEGPRG